jgi:phage-related baseplate assembly protein
MSATCLTTGITGNGLLPGQINKLTKFDPDIKSVENITTTAGGTDKESDADLKKRIRLRPEGFTTAGSELAYIFWTLSAHPNISDVSIVENEPNEPGEVPIYILLKDGVIPAEDSPEIETVENMFSNATEDGKKLRAFCDKVIVLPAIPHEIKYQVEWWLFDEQRRDFETIEKNIKQALIDYEKWQSEKIGREIIPDELIRKCLVSGAKRVKLSLVIDEETEELAPFDYVSLLKNTVAKFTGSKEIFQGYDQ